MKLLLNLVMAGICMLGFLVAVVLVVISEEERREELSQEQTEDS